MSPVVIMFVVQSLITVCCFIINTDTHSLTFVRRQLPQLSKQLLAAATSVASVSISQSNHNTIEFLATYSFTLNT